MTCHVNLIRKIYSFKIIILLRINFYVCVMYIINGIIEALNDQLVIVYDI